VGTSESFRHRHTLFEGHGAVACFGITEGVAYHLRISTVQGAMHAQRYCQESEERRKEGFLGGEPPRNPAPRYRSIGDYLTIVSSTKFKLRVHRECRRHRRRHLRGRRGHRCRDRIVRSMSYRR